MADRTVYDLVVEAAERFGAAPALHQPSPEGGYKTYSWVEYRRAVEEIAAGLLQLGLRKGDTVAVHSETRAEFYLVDLGIMTAGMISAAQYTTYPVHVELEAIRKSGSKALVVDEPATYHKLRQADPQAVPLWILLTGTAEGAITLDALRNLGAKALAENPALLSQLREHVHAEDYAILYMTSGATGKPKMALVTHRAVVANADMGPGTIPLGPEDRTIAFLPSAHITQRVALEFVPLRMGVPVWFSRGLNRLPEEIRQIRPTYFVAPPRMWERIYASISTEIRRRGPLARKLFYGALGVGLEVSRRKLEGRPIPPWLRQAHAVADRVVFRKIRERLGGAMKLPISGAAPLGRDLANFYAAIGMPIYEGYGLTEGGVVCLNPYGAPRPGSIGKALPGVEFRLAEDGELLIKSPTLFSGYLNDPEATAEVLREGWLYTGDIAEITPDGYVYITGRKKEVIVASNGKKIYPGQIETLFRVEPLISQVVLVGDGMPYVVALITINPTVALGLKGMESYRDRPLSELVRAEPVQQHVRRIVERVNQQLAPFEQIRKYHILERDLTIADGELTPTMKVRRAQVLENHKEIIARLYGGRVSHTQAVYAS